MTAWILITMLCTRQCTPVYATEYPTQESCIAHISDKERGNGWVQATKYCVPKVVNAR